MTTTEVTLDQVLALARHLRPVNQARLIARLAPTIEQILTQPQLSDVAAFDRILTAPHESLVR
jgi:hypothetical protein